jgi:hypothetical protein
MASALVEVDIAVAAEGAGAQVAGSIGNDDAALRCGKDQEAANPEPPLQALGDTATCPHDESPTVFGELEIDASNADASSAETSHTLTKAAPVEDAVDQQLCLVVCQSTTTMASTRDIEAGIAVAADGVSIGKDAATPPSGEDSEEVDTNTTLPCGRDPEEADFVVSSIRSSPGEPPPLPEAASTEHREQSTENQKQCKCVLVFKTVCDKVNFLAEEVFYTLLVIVFFLPYALAMIICHVISARQKNGESEEAEHEYQPGLPDGTPSPN